ncbi:MAG: primosomal protein N' [Dokdonella sp.]
MAKILRVAIPIPLAQLFDYELPAGLPAPPAGARVVVPLGPRRIVGIAMGIAAESDVPNAKLKPIIDVLDQQSLLTPELLATLQWAARYYQHPLGEVLETALPVVLRSARPLPRAGEPALALTALGRVAASDPTRRQGTRLDALLQLLTDGPRRTTELDQILPGWGSSARVLRTREHVDVCTLGNIDAQRARIAGPPLNAQQEVAVATVRAQAGQFAPFLLDGVTGSGKTEVYLNLIEDVVARGRQALVLVPEIALTPQMLRRFSERLGQPIASLHSGLSEGARARAWLSAARGDAQVILGTRSAVFVPLPQPGIVIVDEEHDGSYKQQDGFRYHARDLAIVRARALGVPIVLGSATPALETLANVTSGRYRALTLTERAGPARPPTWKIVDLRTARCDHGLAETSLAAIKACIARGEQALVFRNRRGYAPVMHCRNCGWHAVCERCDRPMTLHRGSARLRCHHCGADKRMPAACPQCGEAALAPQGQGTERLEETLVARFPGVEIVRIDRDTARGAQARDALLDRLVDAGPRILVGTQMLAKGHDLPHLTLVVVVDVDAGLFSVDFRASERLGQLLIQVAGRAGRALAPGQVWLQTQHPEHPLLTTLVNGGYPPLARRLLDERRAAALPPFAQFALLRAEAKQPKAVENFLQAALAEVDSETVHAHGPLPAPMPRRAGAHRAQVLIESNERPAMQSFLAEWMERVRSLPTARKVRWSLDVDPGEMG